MYGSTFARTSPGRKPSRSPASTAGGALRGDAAGKKPNPPARLDGGAREDDPTDLPLRQRCDGEGDREVRLAGPRGADPEGDGAVSDRVDVALLRDGLRRDLLAA